MERLAPAAGMMRVTSPFITMRVMIPSVMPEKVVRIRTKAARAAQVKRTVARAGAPRRAVRAAGALVAQVARMTQI